MVRRKRGKCNEFLYLKKYSSAVRNIFCDITVWHFFVTYSDLSWYFTDWYCFTKEFVIRFPSEKVGNLGGLVVIEDESCRQAKRFNPLTRCVWVTTPVKYNNKTFGIITWAAACFHQRHPCDFSARPGPNKNRPGPEFMPVYYIIVRLDPGGSQGIPCCTKVTRLTE